MSQIVTKDNSSHYAWGTNSNAWHFLKRDDLSIIVEEVPPGESEVKHYHSRSRQFFYVISGTASIEVEQTNFNLTENQGIEISPGVLHRFVNTSDRVVRFIVVSMPQSHGDRIEVM